MRKLIALAAVTMFALTLSLGTMGCAPKAEETPVQETTTTTTETTTETPIDTTVIDTTTH